jgi:PhnB protein
MPITPYLFFNGRAEEAAEFYRGALDAKVLMLMRYAESPEAPPPGMVAPGSENKVMHMTLQIGDATLMGADDCTGAQPIFQGFSLSLSPPDAAQAQRVFNKLADGGKVQTPLGKTFFSPCFGMVEDRFGVGWMINVEGT